VSGACRELRKRSERHYIVRIEIVQCIGDDHDFVVAVQLPAPRRRNCLDTVDGAGKLAGDCRRRIGIIAQVGSTEDGRWKVVMRGYGPKGGLERIDDVAAAADLGWPAR